MDSAHRFTVEKIEETAVVVGDISAFGDLIASYYENQGIAVTKIAGWRAGDLRGYDHCVVIGGREKIDLPVLDNATRIYIFEPLYGPSKFDVSVPACRIRFADFIGGKATSAYVLDRFLIECKNNKSLTIPNDGLDAYHLILKEDLDRAVLSVLAMAYAPRDYVLVGSESSSILTIADALTSALPYKIKVKFDESQHWASSNFDRETATVLSNKTSWHTQAQVLAAIPEYIDEFFAQEKTAPPAVYIPPQPKRGVSAERGGHAGQVSHEFSRGVSETESIKETPPPSMPVFVPLEKPRRRLSPLTRIHVSKPRVKKQRPPLPLGWRIALGSLTVAVLLYFFSLVVATTITVLSAKNLIDLTGKGEFLTPRAARIARMPAVYLQANLTVGTTIVGVRNTIVVSDLVKVMSAYILALDTSGTGYELAESGRAIAAYVVGEGEGDLASMISRARLATDTTFTNLSLLDGQLPATPPRLIPARFKEQYEDIRTKIHEARRASLAAKSLLSIAPDILGVGDRRKYAVLFQNNMELRPTGGFIGSFGLISLENGKLFDLQVYDVYTADGQLKGHVEPPVEIKKYLGEANWFMRDSNWDPDFPTSARRAEWFLDKTMGEDVNGVIGINLFSLQEILRATGPLHLAEYNEDVSADNLFERAETHAEINFFPGSTAKKEFLATVADEVMHRLAALPGNQVLDVATGIAKSIDEKHTVLSLGNDVTERMLSTLGWSGELRQTPCPDEKTSCVGDYLMLVDSNFGINKANYFVKRQALLDIAINDDLSVDHTLKVEYTNTAQSSSWPAGPYKNYSRVYLPEGSTVSLVKVGEKQVKKEDITITTEHERTAVGFLVEVPLDSKVTVEVQYATPVKLTGPGSMYSLYWQKQSGTSADPLTIALKYPTKLTPDIVSPKGEYTPGSLTFNLSNVTDRRITVKFK